MKLFDLRGVSGGKKGVWNRQQRLDLAFLAVCLFITSCGGTLRVSSTPSGATVYIKKQTRGSRSYSAVGKTPFSGSAFAVEWVKVRWNDGTESENVSTFPNPYWQEDRSVNFNKARYSRAGSKIVSDSEHPPKSTTKLETLASRPTPLTTEEPTRPSAPVQASPFVPPQSPIDKALHPPTESGLRWAVVIGISEYRDYRVPSLRYAEADALSFYRWLTSSEGGRYAPDRVKLLIGEKATSKNIKMALFQWLKQAIEEDVVTIFFAGHGSTESPDSLKNLYLLPHNVEYDNIPSTAFPMWDIETALKRYIRAKRVIVIADACHSGGIGESFDIVRRAGRGLKVVPVTSGIERLSTVANGICVITASGDGQLSQEGKRWGGGHGCFTYFLLKGLEGEADTNRDDKVSLGELTLYVSQHVRRSTKNAQSPSVAGKFDPALTIGK